MRLYREICGLIETFVESSMSRPILLGDLRDSKPTLITPFLLISLAIMLLLILPQYLVLWYLRC